MPKNENSIGFKYLRPFSRCHIQVAFACVNNFILGAKSINCPSLFVLFNQIINLSHFSLFLFQDDVGILF